VFAGCSTGRISYSNKNKQGESRYCPFQILRFCVDKQYLCLFYALASHSSAYSLIHQPFGKGAGKLVNLINAFQYQVFIAAG
jgi:hypothetical protein